MRFTANVKVVGLSSYTSKKDNKKHYNLTVRFEDKDIWEAICEQEIYEQIKEDDYIDGQFTFRKGVSRAGNAYTMLTLDDLISFGGK